MNARSPGSPAMTTQTDSTSNGARILVDQLRIHSVDRIFCVPGESFLAVLDALVDAPEIAVTTCRHEGGATMMAEAYAKQTGRPAVAFVTRGPGATNGSSGIHVAKQDSTPVILFIGDIERSAIDREAFQEIDYGRMFAPMTKWVTRADDPARLPELLSRAFHTAVSGRPGPVVIALPEDMLVEETATPPSPAPYAVVQPGLSDRALAAIGERLARAERPVVLVGGGGWNARIAADLARFAAAWDLPVCTAFRRNDYFDNAHPNYAGSLGLGANPELVKAVGESDLILALGTRLGEITTVGYSLFAIPRPRQGLIHVHPDTDELGRIYQPELAVNAGMAETMARLADLAPPKGRTTRGWREGLNKSYLAWTELSGKLADPRMAEIMAWLREHLPEDAVITNGAGNFAIWPNRYHFYRRHGTMLAPTSGSMGYGVPAAVAAKLADRGKTVVAFEGDGSFLMTGQELATAAKEAVPIVVILLNNGMYGTIRMHQEKHYPGRVTATSLLNPDFQLLARSYGANAALVATKDEFVRAFGQAVASDRSTVIEIVVDAEIISPTETVTSLRAKSGQAAG